MHSLTVCCDSTFTYSLCVYNNLLKKELVYILIGYKPVLFLSIYIIFTIHINHSISLYCIHIFFHYLCIQYLYSIPYQLYILYIQAILLHQFTAGNGSYTWTKYNKDGVVDTSWGTNGSKTGKTLSVSSADVDTKATFMVVVAL